MNLSYRCFDNDTYNYNWHALAVQREVVARNQVEKYVLAIVSLFGIFFLLSVFKKKRFLKSWLKLPSWACYILMPILISYIVGRMGETESDHEFGQLYSIWAIFLLLTYAGFDSLTAISVDERDERSRIFTQFLIQFSLLILLIYKLPNFKTQVLPIVLAFFVVCLKVVERITSLAHAAGATLGMKDTTRRIICYTNQDEDEEVRVDSRSLQGFKYLVGPRYSTVNAQDVIVDGINLEDIWRSNGKQLLSSESGGGDQDGQLKDTCLSFALFWLLLGKFWGYPPYEGQNTRVKAWKLVCDGLLGGSSGDPERAFRVIEVELNFLHDFFYSKYIFFYLNGFYWKLYSLAAFPLMVWWFTFKAIDSKNLDSFNLYDPKKNRRTTAIVILVPFAMEVIQLCILVSSRWFKVALLSYYAKRVMSKKKAGLLDFCFGKVIGAICRISPCTVMSWKRESNQYSLLESCTSLGVENWSVQAFGIVLGIPLPKPGRKLSSSVVLSRDVKKALGVSLQTNGPKLSNGIASLKRNGVEEQLSWACELKNNADAILAWHIATSICEMDQKSSVGNQEEIQQSQQHCSDQLVATNLSKYCAYLLVFCPSLLPVPLLEAETICDLTIKEARELLMMPGCPGPFRKVKKENEYEKLMELLKSTEVGGKTGGTTLQKGVRLGKYLVSAVSDETRRWKILAEFWAEMILFLAPSDSNEIDHTKMLPEGGEFITHLWALLFHAGIVDRESN